MRFSKPPPLFIYITGADGTGKTTQAELLLAQLKSRSIKARHLWLRFPFFFSLPLLAYARLRGYSWREKIGDVDYGYWDFRRSWLMREVFPWVLLVDAALAALWMVYLPLWRGEMVVCERFVLDMLADQMVAFSEFNFHRHLPGRLYLRLLPLHSLVTVLDLDPGTIRERRGSLKADRCLQQRLDAFRMIAGDLQYSTVSSRLTVDQVNRCICERL